jgi:hypothetical protein
MKREEKEVAFLKKMPGRAASAKNFCSLGALAPPRHCERSEAIHLVGCGLEEDGLLRRCAPRNDGFWPSAPGSKSFCALFSKSAAFL